MLHLAMFLLFAAASAGSVALVFLMLSQNRIAILRALRMEPLHGHVPPAPVPTRARAVVSRSWTRRHPLRAAA